MRQLLGVIGIGLRGVVADELAVVDFEKGFPDGLVAVVGCLRSWPVDNVADEFPGGAAVLAGVEVDVGLGEVSGDGSGWGSLAGDCSERRKIDLSLGEGLTS